MEPQEGTQIMCVTPAHGNNNKKGTGVGGVLLGKSTTKTEEFIL